MTRLDKYLHNVLKIESREKAKQEILNGNILINGKVVKKPAYIVEVEDTVEITKISMKFVGRGGDKLSYALDIFNINLVDKIALDIGASTGGFTDCMLQNNVKKVYAVDVGTNQLHKSLINNKKVIVMENTDIRHLYNKDIIEDKISFFTIDVSFISIKKILNSVVDIVGNSCMGVILLKPQFEVGKEFVGKNGIVSNKSYHVKLLKDIYRFLVLNKMEITNIINSPITGKKGNVEYLILLNGNKKKNIQISFENIVNSGFLLRNK